MPFQKSHFQGRCDYFKSFESVEQFTYLGTTLTDLNSINEEIKGRLKSGNA